MITNHIYAKAFKAGLPGFAVHPGVGTTPNAQVKANLSTLKESSIKTEGNHLTKSLTNFLAHVSKERSYNSSFLNSTSIDSQAATTAFVKALQNMTDFSLQNVDYTRVGNWSCPYKTGHSACATSRINSFGDFIFNPLWG
jgi:hypothetical protein